MFERQKLKELSVSWFKSFSKRTFQGEQNWLAREKAK